tara:strand:- start:11569 stop:12438 length:870 start_codon:yes stop_codon:yes gene_type:complete
MNPQVIKDKISECYYRSLFVDSDIGSHPVKLINSVKSIIGIDFEIVQDKLLDYCIQYSKKCKHVDSFGVLEGMNTPAAVSFATLEESLINNDFKESLNNIDSLLKVSDGKHILEFLLEFCIKYKSDVFQLVWSVYKMSLFLDFKNINENIIFCTKFISNDKIISLTKINKGVDINFNNYSYSPITIKKILTYHSILNEELVRGKKIKEYIKSNVSDQFDFSYSAKKLNFKKEQLEFGRKWIGLYFRDLDRSSLSVDFIITMDMFRSALKISNGKYDKEIWSLVNNFLEK